jgi:hypothetical protein
LIFSSYFLYLYSIYVHVGEHIFVIHFFELNFVTYLEILVHTISHMNIQNKLEGKIYPYYLDGCYFSYLSIYVDMHDFVYLCYLLYFHIVIFSF